MSNTNNHINYIELKAKDLEIIKKFYSEVFAWSFTDYGPTYTSFSESGIAGGFEKTETEITNGALIVIYHQDLESVKSKVMQSKGKISKDIFAFPGGSKISFY